MERFHRTMKAAIMCHASQQWTETLPLVLLSIRTAFKTDLQASSAELVYGEPPRFPGELLTPTSTPHHTAAPEYGSPQTSSRNTPRQSRNICAQGPT
jgi:hypothetical protein